MPEYFFFPTGDTVSKGDVLCYAEAYLAKFAPRCLGDSTAVLSELPPALDLDSLLECVPESDREATRRYLSQQYTTFGPRAREMMPSIPGDAAVETTYVALTTPWRGHGAGTIAGVRRTIPVGLFAVFEGWRIDATGRLTYTESPIQYQPTRPLAIHAAAVDWEQVSHHAADITLTLINYVGQYLAMTGLPGVGLITSLLSSVTQQAVDGSFAAGNSILEAFQKLLQQNRITLENDLSGAVITNYKDYMQVHYSDGWLREVMTVPDPIPQEVSNKLEKLREFVKKITADFDDTSPLFTAVNLMRVTNPSPNDDVHDASESMYKAEGFLYMANVALTLGRQAWNAQYTMEGPAAAAHIAELLASYSNIYTKYALALKAAVDQQVANRVALLKTWPEGGGEVLIWDDYYPTPRAAQAYRKVCCGEADCREAGKLRDKALAQMRIDRAVQYRKDLCSWFWGTDQSFDQAVAAMQDNNAKLKILVDNSRKSS